MSLTLHELASYSGDKLVPIPFWCLIMQKKVYYNYFLDFPKDLLDLMCSYLKDDDTKTFFHLEKICLSWTTHHLPLPVGQQCIKTYALFKAHCPKPLIIMTATHKFSVERLESYKETVEPTHGREIFGDPKDPCNHSKWIVLELIVHKKQVVGKTMIQTQIEYFYNTKTEPA